MSRTRVVVTGLGTTSPVGGDVPSTWDGLLDGPVRRPARSTDDWAEELPVKIAGRGRGRADRGPRAGQGPPPRPVRASSRWSPRWRPGPTPASPRSQDELDSERLGVAMASGIGGVTTLLDNYDVLKEKGPRRVSPLAVPMLMPNAPAANISLYVGARAGGQHPGLGLRLRQRGDRARAST